MGAGELCAISIVASHTETGTNVQANGSFDNNIKWVENDADHYHD